MLEASGRDAWNGHAQSMCASPGCTGDTATCTGVIVYLVSKPWYLGRIIWLVAPDAGVSV